jgi:hypothetical protein
MLRMRGEEPKDARTTMLAAKPAQRPTAFTVSQWTFLTRSLSDIAFVTRHKGGATRCEAAGQEKPEVYSLEYMKDFFWPRTMQPVADRSPQ